MKIFVNSEMKVDIPLLRFVAVFGWHFKKYYLGNHSFYKRI